jgi:plasmid stabilization system protein ParE
MKIEFHPAALAELEEAAAYYEEALPGLAHRFSTAVKAAIQRVSENPRQFAKITRRARRAQVSGFPYGVVYLVKGDVISVKAIMHLHRHPGYWNDRLP